MTSSDSVVPRVRMQTLVWLGTSLTLFLLMALLGLFMRLDQAGLVTARPDLFYAAMTLHGLGMTGAMFMSGLAGVWYLLSRHINPRSGVMWIAYGLIVIGALGLLVGTLVGRFGPGWYVLYPLPFVNPVWASWAIGESTVSLVLLGSGWLLAQLRIDH